MFIISLSIFTLILTVFENIFIAIFFLILLIIFSFFQKKSKKVFLIIFGAFFLSLISILIKNHTYSQKTIQFANSTGLISQNMDGPKGQYFVGTGIISDIYSYQRYIFQDNANREYFLNSEREYSIGDIIRLNGYISIGYTGSKNIFDMARQRQNLGKGVNLSGLFHYEFDYPKWLMMKGFYGTIYEQNSVITSPLSPLLGGEGENIQQKFLSFKEREVKSEVSFLQKIRKNLQENIISAYGKNPKAGLILGMLVGDKSQIPPDEYDGFINSGLVHIIAVSGGNIIMIVVFLSAILFFLPFYVRNAVILLTIIVYAMVCGMDSSVFRATIMGGLGMLALFRGREINIRRAMSIAFIVMLLINPYFLAYDVGFLLSFSAIIGIVYFGKAIEKTPGSKKDPGVKRVLQKITKEYITTTVGATLGVLPIMLFFMGKTNLTGIIANFLVVPIVAVVMIYGFVSTMLFKILPREIWLWPEKVLLNYIYYISDLAESWGVYLQAEGYWIKYTLLILFVVWLILVKNVGGKDKGGGLIPAKRDKNL